jgi:3-hydroxyisobutyrate dehydrogenase
LYLAAAAHGHGFEDDSAVVKVFQALTGIELPTKA